VISEKKRCTMFGSFGWMELLLILIIVLIIFGAGKLPQLGEGLGKAIKGFKKSVHEAEAMDVTPDRASDEPGPPPDARSQGAEIAGEQGGVPGNNLDVARPKDQTPSRSEHVG
jgi:sec-independent protein translocase protein TatA